MPGLFSKKSQPTARPAISFPTRLLASRKRDNHNATPNENLSSSHSARTHVRQRHDSISSVVSVETIRPTTPTGPKTPPPKVGGGNKVSLFSKGHGSRKKARLVLRSSAACNADNEPAPAVNVVAFPSDVAILPAAPPSPKRKAHANADGHSAIQGPSVPKRKRLTRTVSFRSLSGLLENESPVPTSFSGDPEFVAPGGEEIVRCIVRSVAEDQHKSDDDDEEFYALWEESCLRQEREHTQTLLNPGPDSDNVAAFVMKDKSQEIRDLRPTLATESTSTRPQLKRFDVDILPYNRRTVMWDASEKDFYAWPALLYITDHSPKPQGFNPHPPVEALHVECRTIRLGESKCLEEFSDFHPPAEYSTKYMGQKLQGSDILTCMHPSRGICIEPKWSYDRPVSEGGAGGWMIQFWVPVPMRLFSQYEHRAFRLRARIDFGDWQTPRMTAYAGVVDVSIENLRREKHMHCARR